jgi:hypothetical protein
MSKVIMVPFTHLVLNHSDIGLHRGRSWGFRDVFDFHTLRDLPFLKLAVKVKRAYEGRDVPSHEGWPAQQDALRWLVEKGRDGIYALDTKGIKVASYHTYYSSDSNQRYYISDGNHRALAIYILGDNEIRARIRR